MDAARFDELTKRFSGGLSRRQVLRSMIGGAGALTVAAAFERNAGAQGNCDPNADTVTCPAGSFHEGLTKKPDGGCCNGNGNCCSNTCEDNICVGGLIPICIDVVQGDCSELPCCDGLECFDNECLIPICIGEIGGDCSEIDCCDGLACREADMTCIDAGCQPVDEICEVDENCCGNLLCVGGYCDYPDDCSGLGEICEASAECCGDLVCVDSSCGYKLPNTGVASESTSGSARLLTTAIAGGAAAIVAAKVLRSKAATDSTPKR